MRSFTGPASIVQTFIRHPNAANLLMALLILFGAFSLARINTQFFPTVDRPNINVVVSWPGASAEDVETNILAVVEPEVRFIDGVDKVTSYAREGSGTIALEFGEGADMQKALSEAEAAVKGVTTLPEDSETPTVSRTQFFDSVAKVSISGDVPEATLRIWAKKMRDDLVARGIDKVDFTGLRDEELVVEIPERELRRLNMTVADVSRAIENNSRDLPSGNVEGAVDRQLRALADIKTPNALRQLEIKSFSGGEKVHLGDVADVKTGYEDGAVRGFASGKRAIQLQVRRAATADTLATARILEDYLVDAREFLPPNIELHTYEVSADSLSARIILLVKNGLGGLVLVVATLFIFLNFRIAFWVAAGIPIAMMATLALMYISGQSINMISLFALIMMLGVIVDDAIVVGEHTDTRMALGDDPVTAAENGVGMMLTPVMAAMTTTVASFAPIVLITGVIGQIMGVMPYVVIAVIIASLVECFLVLPGHLAHALRRRPSGVSWSFWRQLFFALAAAFVLLTVNIRFGSSGLPAGLAEFVAAVESWRSDYPLWLFSALVAATAFILGTALEGVIFLVRRIFSGKRSSHDLPAQGHESEGRFRRVFDAGFNRFRDGPFRRLVALSFRWRYVTASISLGIAIVVAVGLIRSGRVEFVFFPSPEAENIRGFVSLNAGAPEAEAVKAVNRFETALRNVESDLGGGNEKLIRAVFTTLGKAGRSTGDNLAEIRVQLTSSEDRTVRTADIVRAWRKSAPKIPGVRRFSVIEIRGGPPGRDIEVQLQGAAAGVLKAAATEVSDLLSGIAGVSGVSDDLPYGKPELVMELLPRGAALGFSINDVGRQVRNAFEGAIPRRFARGDDEITVRVTQKMRQSGSAALRNFELKSPAGGFVPLTEVVRLRGKQGFAAIQRRDGKSTLAVSGDIDNTVNTTDGVIAQLEDSGSLAMITTRYGIAYKYGGRAEEQRDAFTDLGIGTAIALSVIYIILAWVFGSYWLPFGVMLIIPFGIVGAVFGHWILGYQLTILSLIGLLGLAGILVNDSIILVTRLLERLAEGQPLHEATIGASQDRLRAVLLTSLTTIGGLMPLMYEKSLQAQFLLPMAITIVFGLGLATLLVLFLVPTLIGIGNDIGRFLRLMFGQARLRSLPAE